MNVVKRDIIIRKIVKKIEKSSITEETPNGVILKILQIRGLKDQKTPPPSGTPKTLRNPTFSRTPPKLEKGSQKFEISAPKTGRKSTDGSLTC